VPEQEKNNSEKTETILGINKVGAEILTQLRRPFPAESVKFKIQTSSNRGALVVAYIDARHVAERLNVVCPMLWSDKYREIYNEGKIVGVECSITIRTNMYGPELVRTDVGVGDLSSPMGGIKILYSDAFKRAGVKLGIGAFLYTLPSSNLKPEHLWYPGGQPDDAKSPMWKKARLTFDSEKNLIKKYAKWVKDTGEEHFGPIMEHGDVMESQGDIEVEDG
jgi:hypothetical protein